MVVEIRPLGTSLEVGCITLFLVFLAICAAVLVGWKYIAIGAVSIVVACFALALPALFKGGN